MLIKYTVITITFFFESVNCAPKQEAKISFEKIAPKIYDSAKRGEAPSFSVYGRRMYDVVNVLEGADLCNFQLKRRKKKPSTLKSSATKALNYIKENKTFKRKDLAENCKIQSRRCGDIISIFLSIGLIKRLEKCKYQLTSDSMDGAKEDNSNNSTYPDYLDDPQYLNGK